MATLFPLMPKSSPIQGILCFGDPLLLSVLHPVNYEDRREIEVNVVDIQSFLAVIQGRIRWNHYRKYIIHHLALKSTFATFVVLI